MSVSNIQQIREVEEASEAKILKAETEAQKLISDAREEVQNLLNKAKEDADKEAKHLRSKAEEDTEKEISAIEKESAARKEALYAAKKEKLDQATDSIIKIITE